MKRLLMLACLVVPATAMADVPYGNSSGCAKWRGETTDSDDSTLYTGDSFQYHESGCDVTERQSAGNGVELLKLTCSGEGETWVEQEKIQTSSDRSTVSILNPDIPGGRLVLRRCK